MTLFRGRHALHASLLVLALAAASAAVAENPSPTMSRPIVGTPFTAVDGPPRAAQAPDGAGYASAMTWIPATKFTGRLGPAVPLLTYVTNHYYNSPGSASPARYFAPIDLEPGVFFWKFNCAVKPSATQDVWIGAQRYSGDPMTGVFTVTNIAMFGTLSSTYQWFGISGFPVVTISPYGSHPTLNNYYLFIDIADDTMFAGCLVYWRRQVSPAPATATFTDVPTSYWAFQYIEALKAAQITGGVTPTTYEPESNVTRAQMAVFLAKALGLHFPN